MSFTGKYNKGTISRTQGQIKKHVSQMTGEEKLFLRNTLRKLDSSNIKLCYHAQNNNVVVDIEQIRELVRGIEESNIVEYNEVEKRGCIRKRVLVRDDKEILVKYDGRHGVFEKMSNLCFVIDIETAYIITTYYNIAGDSHNNINMTRYDASLKIINENSL